MKTVRLTATVPPELALQRLDRVARELFPEYSRNRLQQWIRSGELLVNGSPSGVRDKVPLGAELVVAANLEELALVPERISLNVIHEDDEIIVVNKPAGVVVHPGAGNLSGTLANGLLHHDPLLSNVPRAGIVHRLDKDTTGLMVVARTLKSQTSLVKQLEERTAARHYTAVVYGVLGGSGTVTEPIRRHPVYRTRMAVHPSGKFAATYYEPLAHYDHHTLTRLKLATGRTHQIRVHMQHIGFPLIGDTTYGGTYRQHLDLSDELQRLIREFDRQALHAHSLSFVHPGHGGTVSFRAPVPEDVVTLIAGLELG